MTAAAFIRAVEELEREFAASEEARAAGRVEDAWTMRMRLALDVVEIRRDLEALLAAGGGAKVSEALTRLNRVDDANEAVGRDDRRAAGAPEMEQTP
jgi:hypothetical protein